MEGDIRKQGMLYLQQQRFGKKWKRVWCVLYRESSCSISRLEFFECKDGATERNDKSLRKQQEHKKVIRLADCIRVSEVEMEGCPRDTGPFLVETTEKIYVFAADRQQVDDWTHKLCEIAFPMSWTEVAVKRGSLHRGSRVEEDEGMEDNSLYSGRETVRDFRVCVRRTEASDRCRLKGDVVLRADVDALHLLDKTGDVVFTWPYRFLRRFGRDKSTFSFEAGRRCDSGEGGFEFDTKQGNFLFQAVEAAINRQRIALPLRQTSGGGGASPETNHCMSLPPPPLSAPLGQSRTPQPRGHYPQPPAAAEAADGVYSMVTDHPAPQRESSAPSQQQQQQQQQQQRPPLTRLEPPSDKVLTGVKSLNLDARGGSAPRKNQVKMISSCPLPHAEPGPAAAAAAGPAHGARLSPKLSANPTPDQMYSQITMAGERGAARERKERGGSGLAPPPQLAATPPDPEYSLPFDTLNKSVIADLLSSHQPRGSESGADPLYDSIDEMKIRNVFPSNDADDDALGPAYSKVEHIYDEPEGCAAAAAAAAAATGRGKRATHPPSLYDDPEEMRGDAWRIMGTAADPKGHEYPYNPRVDDYAVPKRPQRAFPAAAAAASHEEGGGGGGEEDGKKEEEEEEEEEEDEDEDSGYNNIMVKIA